MAKKVREHWKPEPDAHDFPAAADYLSLTLPSAQIDGVIAALKAAPLSHHKAKDLLRSSCLDLLPEGDPDVSRDLLEVRRGRRLSPVLLVRGDLGNGTPLTIADGYHRICASYHLGEDQEIPCRLAENPLPQPQAD